MAERTKTEIIAFCSGKGGTGKSLMCSCFGYALLHGGQRVLMIDGDPATDGLSLFLLGPKGQDQIPSFSEQNTFIGALEKFQKTGSASFEPRAIHRRGEDHGTTYNAIISGKGLYGEGVLNMPVVPDLNQGNFRAGIRHLFDQLRQSGEYDYVLVDTRGGFAFESTDLCALADSFVVITEPDYTSYYQDRNLVSRIAAAAREVESPSLLRAMIVNKAVDVFAQAGKPYLDTLEVLFRDQLVKEFPIRFKDTYPVPVSIEALLAYKAQKIPYRSSPESLFCMATLSAFSDILEIVTSRWTVEQVDKWNELVDTVARAVKQKQEREEEAERARVAREQEFERMRAAAVEGEARVAAAERDAAARMEAMRREYELHVASLQRELDQRTQLYEREYQRSETLIGTTIAQATTGNVLRSSLPQASSSAAPMTMPPSYSGDAAVPSTKSALPLRVWLGLVATIVLAVLIWYVIFAAKSKAKVPAVGAAPSEGAPVATESAGGERAVSNNYAVLLWASDSSLPAGETGASSAALEAQRAQQAVSGATALYQKDGLYTAAVLYSSREQATAAVQSLQAAFKARWAKTIQIVTMSEWCPVKTALDPILINEAKVPVWYCITASPGDGAANATSPATGKTNNAPSRTLQPKSAPRSAPKMSAAKE